MRSVICLTLVLVVVAVMTWASAAPAGTIILREGLSGYNGTTDVYIDSRNPSGTYLDSGLGGTGGRKVLEVWGDSLGEATPPYDTTLNGYFQALLEFDNALAGIPAGSSIDSATLTLYVQNAADDLRIYRMTTAWDETNATWNHFGSGAPGAGGGITAATDTFATPDYFGTPSIGTHGFDVTATVTAWFNGDPNEGWGFLLANKNRGLLVNSRDSIEVDRPMLTIEFTEPVVPEPGTIVLLVVGVVGLLPVFRRRRRR